MSDVPPDAEVACRTWALQLPSLHELVGDRVATNLPPDPFESDSRAFITIFRVGGGPLPGEAFVDRAFIQWDVYGPKKAWRTASHAARVLTAEAHKWNGGHLSGVGPENAAWLYDFEVVSGPRRIPEPETMWARYLVETLVTVRESAVT